MIKSTEYGAIAILSASGYGNPSKASNITTTTGNNTGMILSTSAWEWVAGCLNASFGAINPIYYDSYGGDSSSAKVGDALATCARWHGASYSTWVNGYNPFFLRGDGGIFSFSYLGSNNSYACRGVLVCGAGL